MSMTAVKSVDPRSPARRAGVRLRGLSGYYMARPERCPANTVVLGYASLADGEIPALAEALRTAFPVLEAGTGYMKHAGGKCRLEGNVWGEAELNMGCFFHGNMLKCGCIFSGLGSIDTRPPSKIRSILTRRHPLCTKLI